MAPQIIVFALLIWNLSDEAVRHGQEKQDPYDKYSFGRLFWGSSIFFALLWWGGFWNVMIK